MTVRHPKIKAGDVFPINNGGSVTVIEYRSAVEIVIQHNDAHAHICTTRAEHLRTGKVRNPYHRSVFGVGFVGAGKYAPVENGKPTPAYMAWDNMMTRCYSAEFKEKNQSYRDCEAVPDWHNFQDFADWFYRQPNSGRKGFAVDKDLTVIGNKTYGPETCSIVPSEINNIFLNVGAAGETGSKLEKRSGKFVSQISIGGKNKYLGSYATEHEARTAYRAAKQEYVKALAERHKGILSRAVYSNLLSWRA